MSCLDGSAVVDVILGDAGVVILIAPAACRGIQPARGWRDSCQADGGSTRIRLAWRGIDTGVGRQTATRILRIAAALAGIRGIRDQRIGVVETNGIGWRSQAVAAPERFGIRIAGTIERGITAGRTGLPTTGRRQR